MGPSAACLVHPPACEYKTPVNSIFFIGVMTLGLGLAGLTGVGQQEAFQLLSNASGIF
jgi:hypothetical protein